MDLPQLQEVAWPASAMRHVIARAPTRVDLGGGWTDVPPYCDREGGFVCNVAISRYSTVRLTATSPGDDAGSPLVRAALRRAGLSGVRVEADNDFPLGAGLGGSSAASAALLGALARWRGLPIDRAEIAEEGRRIEVEDLGIAGGRQDHYAATHGGALALTFTTTTSVRRLVLDARTRAELLRRSILVYSGESRISGDTIVGVLSAYERGDAAVVQALARMRTLAREMAQRLECGDVDGLGILLGQHWSHQRSLHPSIPTARIDEIIERARSVGAMGAKAMGASGGGCVLIVCGPEGADAVREVVRPLGEIVDFGFDDDGLLVRDSVQ